MNYSSLIAGAVVVIFSTLYYFLRARRMYQGPIVETGPRDAKSLISIEHGAMTAVRLKVHICRWSAL